MGVPGHRVLAGQAPGALAVVLQERGVDTDFFRVLEPPFEQRFIEDDAEQAAEQRQVFVALNHEDPVGPGFEAR